MDVKIDKGVIIAALALLLTIMLKEMGIAAFLMIVSFIYFLNKK